MTWVKIHKKLLDDYDAHMMSKEEFVKHFMLAVNGQESKLSKFVSVCPERPSGGLWDEIRRRIFARDNYTCQYCGKRGNRLECDHVIPVSRNGTHNDDNLVTSCFECNRAKGNKLLSEWDHKNGKN